MKSYEPGYERWIGEETEQRYITVTCDECEQLLHVKYEATETICHCCGYHQKV